MAQRRELRVFFGPDDTGDGTSEAQQSSEDDVVKIAFGELLNTMAEAVEDNRAWIEDFRDEEVAISRDLYQVIQAYRRLRRAA